MRKNTDPSDEGSVLVFGDAMICDKSSGEGVRQ